MVSTNTLANLTVYADSVLDKAGIPANGRTEYDIRKIPAFMAESIFSQSKEIPIKHLRYCVIDEEYYEQLEKNGLEDSIEHQQAYSNGLSNEESFRLFKKNGFDKQYCPALISIGIMYDMQSEDMPGHDETGYSFDVDTSKQIEHCLEEVFGAGNVYVPGYILEPEEATGAWHRLMVMGQHYFENNSSRIFYGKWEEQKNYPKSAKDNIVYLQMYVPIVFKGIFSSNIFTQKEKYEEEDRVLYPFRQEISEYTKNGLSGRMQDLIQNAMKNSDAYIESIAVGNQILFPKSEYIAKDMRRSMDVFAEKLNNIDSDEYIHLFESLSPSQKRQSMKLISFLKSLKMESVITFSYKTEGHENDPASDETASFFGPYLNEREVLAAITKFLQEGTIAIIRTSSYDEFHENIYAFCNNNGKMVGLRPKDIRQALSPTSDPEKDIYKRMPIFF